MKNILNHMTKVVHLQKHLPTSGNAAFRLHCAMLEAGIDSSMLSLSSDLDGNERIKHLNRLYQLISWLDGNLLKYLTRKSIKQFGLFSFPIFGCNISQRNQIKQADVIYLHWINGGFLNLKNIKQLAKLNKPIVFFMHDMWTITGGCHHSFQCEKYKTYCNSCQVFPGNRKVDLSKIEFSKKVNLFSGSKNIFFISPSKWLFDCSIQSVLTKTKPIYYIPNIIDNRMFKPFDKTIAKRILNIDPDAKVITFGAVSIDSPYKGLAYLLSALVLLKSRINIGNVVILVFGSSINKEIAEAIPFETKFIGRLRDDYSTNLMYNASDVFLAPSLADNLPTTIMESMCCGTPVVGFNVGGIPELIEHGKNGYLAKYKDSEDMTTGIKYCLENQIKGYLLPIFEPDNLVKKHLDLLEELNSGKL